MSFRIDDILKKDKCEKVKKCHSIDNSYNNSILQKTLQTKAANLNNYYLNDYSSAVSNFYPSYNCDVFFPFQSLNSFVDRGCSSVYSRSRCWPPHTSIPALFPLSYAHYSKRKGGQVRFTSSQTEALEKRFGSHKYLSPEDRRILAGSLKLSDRQVKTWFQNRRAKWRRCNSVSSNSSESTIKVGVFNEDSSENEIGEVNISRSVSPVLDKK